MNKTEEQTFEAIKKETLEKDFKLFDADEEIYNY